MSCAWTGRLPTRTARMRADRGSTWPSLAPRGFGALPKPSSLRDKLWPISGYAPSATPTTLLFRKPPYAQAALARMDSHVAECHDPTHDGNWRSHRERSWPMKSMSRYSYREYPPGTRGVVKTQTCFRTWAVQICAGRT